MKRNPRKKTPSATRDRCITAADWRRLHLPGTPGKISGDPEIRAFVDGLLDTTTMVQIAEACKQRFGAARAPGKSAVHRYWSTFRASRVRGDIKGG
jgi:hypothetical protein